MDEKLIEDFINTVYEVTRTVLLPSEVEEHFARFLVGERPSSEPEMGWGDPATRMDLGWIMDNSEDIWYRQTDDTYRVRFGEYDWAKSYRGYSRQDIRTKYGIKGESG